MELGLKHGLAVLIWEWKAFFCCPFKVDGLVSYELDPQFESAFCPPMT